MDDFSGSGADEPTAMWDSGSAGEQTDPASKKPSIPVTIPPRRRPPGLSWSVTIALALVLGVCVYLVVRALR